MLLIQYINLNPKWSYKVLIKPNVNTTTNPNTLNIHTRLFEKTIINNTRKSKFSLKPMSSHYFA